MGIPFAFLQRTSSPAQPNDAYGYNRVANVTRLPHQLLTLRQSLSFDGFFQLRIWKHAALECCAMTMLVFFLGLVASQLMALVANKTASVLTVSMLGSLVNLLTIPLFIWAAAPDSGGHVNPFITMSTFFAGLTSFPQSLLYIVGQSIGSVIGGYLLKFSLDESYFTSGTIPSCTFDTSLISLGQVFVLETMTALTLMFMAFGVGLDPRQAPVFGPVLGPFLVGLALAMTSFCAAFVKPGYTGASLNPGRCLGLMAPTGNMKGHWIHWVADLAAAMLNGMMWWSIPSFSNQPLP
ncbi:MIP transporter [Venturia nashicola]|uniref:MIP transporter n=1 Tax=Venturia nashicola TaxID=86259 RepID=A0A4Z1NGS5_9PEZI|nr:MIP transporter [Venturia nashicola]